MAYLARNLSVLAYANGFTLWHYTTEDNDVSVGQIGYFSDASDLLRKGDIIIANCDTAGAGKAGFFLVVSNLSGVVDASNLTQVGSVNTN